MNSRNFTNSSNFLFGTTLLDEEVIMNIQDVNLPGISMSHSPLSSQTNLGYIQGDTLTYSPLNVNVILDENMEVWTKIVQTMKNMSEDDGTAEEIHSNSWLIIENNNHEPLIRIDFYNTIIESFGDITFTSTSENEELLMDVNFLYDHYEVSSLVVTPP